MLNVEIKTNGEKRVVLELENITIEQKLKMNEFLQISTCQV